MSAASRIKRLKPDSSVTVLEENSFTSHAPCGLPYFLGGLIPDLRTLMGTSPEKVLSKRGIKVESGTRAIKIDPDSKTVYAIKSGERTSYSYDLLLIATGSSPISLNIDGSDESDRVFTLGKVKEASKAKEVLNRSEKIGIIGGGYIGLETTEELVKLGKRVKLFEALPHVMSPMDPEISERIEKILGAKGVELHLEEPVEEVKTERNELKVYTAKASYTLDALIVAVGIKPNSEIAEDAGVKLGVKNSVEVNEFLQTNIPNIYAAGDVCEMTHVVSGRKVWIPLATTANKMGYVAGLNMLGYNVPFPGTTGTAIFKLFDLAVARTGLNLKEAEHAGFKPIYVDVESHTRAHYYPGYKNIFLRMIADMNSKLLLGAEIIGEEGVAGRINTVASLLLKKASIKGLFFSDLCYAPPFAPVWDPLVISARLLMRKLRYS